MHSQNTNKLLNKIQTLSLVILGVPGVLASNSLLLAGTTGIASSSSLSLPITLPHNILDYAANIDNIPALQFIEDIDRPHYEVSSKKGTNMTEKSITTVKNIKKHRKRRGAPLGWRSEVAHLIREYFYNMDKDCPKTYIEGEPSKDGDNYPTMAKLLALCGGEGTINSPKIINAIISPLIHHINNQKQPEIYDFKPTALFEITQKEIPKKVALIKSLEGVLKSEDKTYTCAGSVDNMQRSDPAFYGKYIESVKALEIKHYEICTYKNTILEIVKDQIHMGIFKRPDPIYAFRIIKEEQFAGLNTKGKKDWMADRPHMYFMPSYNAAYIKATLYIVSDILVNYINQEIGMMRVVYPKRYYSCTEKKLQNYLYTALKYAIQVFDDAHNFDIHFIDISQIYTMVENTTASINLYFEFSKLFKRETDECFGAIIKNLYKDHEEMCLHSDVRVDRAKNRTKLLNRDILTFKKALKYHVSRKELQEKNIKHFMAAITPYVKFEENKLSFKDLETIVDNMEADQLIKEKLQEYASIREKIQSYKQGLIRTTFCSSTNLNENYSNYAGSRLSLSSFLAAIFIPFAYIGRWINRD